MNKDLDVDVVGGGSFHMATEDILAIGAVIVAIIISYGIVIKTVDVAAGGTIIIALVGGAAIAQVIKSKRRQKRKLTQKPQP